ncbi:MAG: hypothetical protein ACRETD_13760, partial [Steroidobacteraceae bacterium]
YPPELRDLLLPDPENAEDLAARLLSWNRNPEGARRRFEAFGAALRACTAADMARQIVELSAPQAVQQKRVS